MQSEMWAWLLRRVPAEQHNQLMVVTGSGTEIAVQALLRIEAEFLVIKGRLAGSQDAGRIYFIPFTHIDYFGLQRDIKESEFDAIFGNGSLRSSTIVDYASEAANAAAEPPSPPSTPTPIPAPVPPVEVPAPMAVSQKTPLPLKSEVLERFRARIAGASVSNSGTTLRPADG